MAGPTTPNYAWQLPDPAGANNYPGDMATLGDAIDSTLHGLIPAGTSAGLQLGTCKAATRTNVASLSGTTTMDGVAVAATDRVFLAGQTTGTQNGPWIIQAGAWTRPTDYANGAVVTGAEVAIAAGGTSYGGSSWHMTNIGSITVGTTATTWAIDGGGAADIMSRTFSISGVPVVGISDENPYPGFNIPIVASKSIKIHSVIAVSPGASAGSTYKLRRLTGGSWGDITGFGTTGSPLTAGTSGAGTPVTPGDVALVDNDVIALWVVGAGTGATGLRVTVELISQGV